MPIASRTFRVFVSSTFDDMIEERNALQREVFPALAQLCEAHGTRFQAIDLRWGVRDQAVLGHKMMETCLAEIERCQRTRIKPNFIVLLGDRYGKPPLPARVHQQEFEAVLSRVDSELDRALIGRWYQRDDNAVPAEYRLKPRAAELVDANRWREVEDPLGAALRKAAQAASLTPNALLKYEGSASHQEIVKGLGTIPEDRRHTFAFLRVRDGAKEPPELAELKSFLRAQLGERAKEYGSGDIANLCRDIRACLSGAILDEVSRFASRTTLDLEVEAHDAFARDRAHHFVGRSSVRRAITDYLKGADPRPLLVHGPSGSGKSAIIARASEDHVGIRRFIGATPEASNGLTLLRSLCAETGARYGQAAELPATFNELTHLFQDRLSLATADLPLILYIDALDQLAPQDPAAAMDWLPRQLPPHCRLVLSTIEVPAALSEADIVLVRPFSIEEAGETLDLWLGNAGRTLQKEQREKLLQAFGKTPLPLYLKLAFEEARLWRSFDPLDKCVLGDGLSGIIDRLFARLSEPGNHGPVLVSHALGFLAAARYGLSEGEILDVLTANDAVWKDFEGAKRHDLPAAVRRLPVIVWSRLYLDLEPYLTEREVPGGRTISFFHRQLADNVSKDKSSRADLAAYFQRQSNWREPQQANERRITEVVRLQIGAALLDEVAAVLTDLDFVWAKCAAGLVFDLQEDYREAIGALPEARAGLSEQERTQSELTRWSQTLIDCARNFRLPKPEEIIQSVEPWSDQRIDAECERIFQHPTRLDRLEAFACFVEQEANSLLEFGRLEGFAAQQAFNSAPRGPVRVAAAGQIDGKRATFLLRRWPENAMYNPKPALLRTLEAHSSVVAVTPDGRRAISASSELKVWDLETGREVRTFSGHADWVTSVAVTPDGRRAVSASRDKTLKVWDVETGRELHTLKGHADWVTSVAVTPDGRRAISASRDKALMVWDLESRCMLLTLEGHTREVSDAAITPDGRRAISASEDLSLKVWNLESGRALHTLLGHSGSVTSVAVTPDGRIAVSASMDQSLIVWDVEAGRKLRRLGGHWGGINGVAVTPDGRHAVTASSDCSVKVWDIGSGRELRTFLGHSGDVHSVALRPDGRRVVSVSSDLKVWNVETGRELRVREGRASRVWSLAATPDGRRAVSASWDELSLWEVDTGCLLRRFTGHAFAVLSVAITPDGHRAVSASTDKTLKVWDLETGRQLHTLTGHSDSVHSVAVTPDGRRAVSASKDSSLKVWDLETSCELGTLEGHTLYVTCVTVTRDGRRAVSGSYDKTIKVWDLETGWELCTLAGHLAYISSVAVTPDGRRAVSASGDNTIKVWNLETGSELCTLEGHSGWITCVVTTPDGDHVVSASMDRTVRIWDLRTAACCATLRMNASVSSLAWVRANCVAVGLETGDVLFFNVWGGSFEATYAGPLAQVV